MRRSPTGVRCAPILRGSGFTYVGVMIMLAVLGISAAATLQLGQTMFRYGAEESLLDVGQQFSQALESYRRVTPAGEPDAPMELAQLLRDPRFPGVVRHLRRIYDDPMTGKTEWGLVRSAENQRIVGVHSLATGRPIKIGNFPSNLQALAQRTSYRDWVFAATLAAGGKTSARGGGLISPLDLDDDPPEPLNRESHHATGDKPVGRLISPLDLD